MKAQYVEFNGDWHKDCSRCAKPYGAITLDGLSTFFKRDPGKADGFCPACKECDKRTTDRKKALVRKKRWLLMNGKKSEARTKAKHAFPGPYECAVLICEEPAELHHVNYEEALAVVPLCKKHHADDHRTHRKEKPGEGESL